MSPTFIRQVLPDLNFCGMFFFIALAKVQQLIGRKQSVPRSLLTSQKALKPTLLKLQNQTCRSTAVSVSGLSGQLQV